MIIDTQKKECPVVIAYFGGKFQMSKKFVPMIPQHDNYIELFAGGLSMFFRKAKAKWNLVNDLNADIANLYTIIANPYAFNEFVQMSYWLVHSKKIFDITAEEIESTRDFEFPSIKRAVYYYFYISNSFNQRLETGYSDKISNWRTSLKDNLKMSREKLDGTIVENRDYKYIVDRYWDKENTFWYIDPPYVVTDEVKYYKYNFKESDHSVLKTYIDKIVKNPTAKIMISYDDYSIIRKLYGNSPYVIEDITFKYASNAKTVNELLIMNYKPLLQEGLF